MSQPTQTWLYGFKVSLLLSVVLFFIVSDYSAQSIARTYDILAMNKKIGELVVSLEDDGNEQVYRNRSVIEMKMLRTVEIVMEQEAIYRQGSMMSAKSRMTVNGKIHKDNILIRKNQYYEVHTSDGTLKVNTPIVYSAILLMLKEPSKVNTSFSEHDLEFHRIEKISANTYLKTSPDGKEARYEYREGELIRAEVDTGWYKFAIRLRA